MSAGHTPGPWGMEARLDGDVEIGPPEEKAIGHVNMLAVAYGDDNDPECWPVTANAKLIAAAPVLADALEALVVSVSGDGERFHRTGLENARLALRLAGRLP